MTTEHSTHEHPPPAATPVPIIHYGPVQVDGMVRTQPVSAPESSWATVTVPQAGTGVRPLQLLSNDNRRMRAIVLAIDQDVILANSEAELLMSGNQAAPGGGGYLPKGIPLVIESAQDLWGIGATAAAKVMVHTEMGYPLQ